MSPSVMVVTVSDDCGKGSEVGLVMGEVGLGLFTAVLGLSVPWGVTRTEFDGWQLDLYLDFSRGSRFPCPAKDCA